MSYFVHHPAPTEIYTLSLHDALPIYYLAMIVPKPLQPRMNEVREELSGITLNIAVAPADEMEGDEVSSLGPRAWVWERSEEHTSELQSRLHLVCRLLLEKKN